MMPERRGKRRHRKQQAGSNRHGRTGDPDLFEIQRKNRTDAAVDELDAEDHSEKEQEVLERQHGAETDARRRDVRRLARFGALLFVEQQHQEQRDRIQPGGDEKRPTQADGAGQQSTDHRADRRSEPLGRLHGADRRGHPIARGRLRGHRQRQSAVPGEKPQRGAKREHVPGPRHQRHQPHHDGAAHQRARHHDPAPVAIGQPAPEGRHQRGQRRGHAEDRPGPQGDLADVGHAKLPDEKREKRHHQREASEADERGGGDGEQVAAPVIKLRTVF